MAGHLIGAPPFFFVRRPFYGKAEVSTPHKVSASLTGSACKMPKARARAAARLVWLARRVAQTLA
jgi:hypothetical protein